MMGLTQKEKEVLKFLTEDFETPKRIAIRRQTSVQAVYKIINKLKKEGYIKKSFVRFKKSDVLLNPPHILNLIRLHGQEFNIKIISKDDRYKEILNKCNHIEQDGSTIRLYNDSIEVYMPLMFYGEDAQQTDSKAIPVLQKLIYRLEDRLKVVLIKNGYENIKRVNAHYSEINNEVARDLRIKSDKLRIYTKEDGKLWFLMDYSLNVDEAEAVHPKTSKQDITTVKEFFNDLRDNEPCTITQLKQIIGSLAKEQLETKQSVTAIAQSLNIVISLLKPIEQPKAIKEDDTIPSYIN
jgi:DNA-binding Lrp family transcriptional regulator